MGWSPSAVFGGAEADIGGALPAHQGVWLAFVVHAVPHGWRREAMTTTPYVHI